MKKINIWALVLLVLGVLSWLYLTYGPCPFGNDYASCGFGRGMLAIWVSYPFILIGIILFIIGLFIKFKQNKK